MDKTEINLRDLKRAVDAILDHVIEDLGVQNVTIEDQEDFFWDSPPSEMYDASKQPREWWTGRLSDDLDFIQQMLRSDSGYLAFMLNHAAPLLRYVAKQVTECGPPEIKPPKAS